MSEDDPLKNDVLLQLNDNDNANEPGDETEENERQSETGAEVTLRNRFKNDEAFRQKIMVWVCLCLSTALLVSTLFRVFDFHIDFRRMKRRVFML